MKQEIQKITHAVDATVIESTTKTGVGFMGAFAAMTINDMAGLVVAVLTAVYMVFQIEAAWQRRKKRKDEGLRNKD